MSCLCCWKRRSEDLNINGDFKPDRKTYEQPAAPTRILSHSEKDYFFVITPIFNPASFKKRYDLYHRFAQHMKDSGAQLITIECIFPTLNQHHFQVTEANNPYHIQLKSDSIYWMKENLINIAVSRLPSHAKWVCWLDADIYFHEKNWIEQTLQELKKFTVVQLFKKANFLGPNGEIMRVDYSFGYSVIHNKPIDQTRYEEWYPHPGYGWAMSKTAFNAINGLPEYDIVGSGDLHFAFSLLNRVSNAIERDLNPDFKWFIINQSREIFTRLMDIAKSEGKFMVGYTPLTINHNWHGSRKDRQYVDRWKILIAHNFNYLTDVTKSREGLLLLNEKTRRCSDDHRSLYSLQEDIQVHFQKRNEDGSEYEPDENLINCPPKFKPIKKKKKAPLHPKKIKFKSEKGHSGSSSSSSSDGAGNPVYYIGEDGTIGEGNGGDDGGRDSGGDNNGDDSPNPAHSDYDHHDHDGHGHHDHVSHSHHESYYQDTSQSDNYQSYSYADNYGGRIETTSHY